MTFSELPDSKETGIMFVSDSRLLFSQKHLQIFLKGEGLGAELSQGEPEQPCPRSPSHPRTIHRGHSHCSCCLVCTSRHPSALLGFGRPSSHSSSVMRGLPDTHPLQHVKPKHIFLPHCSICHIKKILVYGRCFFYLLKSTTGDRSFLEKNGCAATVKP